MLILNSEKVQDYILKIAFLDAKRPFTKKVLDSIDFHRILQTISISDIIDSERQLGLKEYFSEEMFDEFKQLPEFSQQSLRLCM